MRLTEIRSRNNMIPSLVKQGATVGMIARQHRLRPGYIQHILRREGLEAWQYSTKARDSMIRTLRREGFSPAEIAEELGLTAARISQIAPMSRRRRRRAQ